MRAAPPTGIMEHRREKSLYGQEKTGDEEVAGQTMKENVREFMERYEMAGRGDGVLAAVSGGADSVCLLFVLNELSVEMGFRLEAFHLNHGLRGGEAERDQAYVRALCGRLNITLTEEKADVAGCAVLRGISCEEAGRLIRYEYLEKTAEKRGLSRIATAHHKGDTVETTLFHLFRGSGLMGLGGIRPVRGKIIRPLLCADREEIEAYLLERGESWCEDSTNGENTYTRNKIRNQLLPWVEREINGRAADHILNAASLAAQADEYFYDLSKRLLESDEAFLRGMREGRTEISTALLDGQPQIVKTYLIRELIRRSGRGWRDISERHIRAVLELKGPGGGSKTDLPDGLLAVRSYETLAIGRREEEKKGRPPVLQFDRFPYKKGDKIPKNIYTKWFDYDKIKGALCVRNRREGDYFLLAGGKKKSLRRFFIDEKIPETERESVFLLAEGSHILWVIGYRVSEFYKITESTKNILEVKTFKGEDHG